jgi:hypothetical protein
MSQPQITNYDRSKGFLFGNDYDKANYTASGNTTLEAYTVLGRVLATNKVVPCESDASDGSQNPIGVLQEEYVVADGDTVELSFCHKGWVNENLLVFTKEGDGLDTSVGTEGKMRDLIHRNTGIILKAATEHTSTDNQ